MEKYTFTIRTSFIPPNGRLPRFKDLPQDIQKEYAGKAEAEDIVFIDTVGQPLLSVKRFKTTAKAAAKDGILLNLLSMAQQKKTGLKSKAKTLNAMEGFICGLRK